MLILLRIEGTCSINFQGDKTKKCAKTKEVTKADVSANINVLIEF